MYKLKALVVFVFLTPFLLVAKTTPEEGGKLNYRIIGFSFPEQGSGGYKLQIAAGNHSTEKEFEGKIIVTAPGKKNKIVAEVPEFGKQYTWRVLYEGSSKQTKSALYHFSTMMAPEVNEDSVRMRMILSTEKYKGYYVFVDCNKVLYDMNGRPVWFFPKLENTDPRFIHLRDLSATPFGTITSIVSGRIYEISYSGNILWQGPNNGGISMSTTSADHGYHHEFTRLANGHYMVMGFEQPYWQLPRPPDSSVYRLVHDKIKCENNVCYQKMLFGTVLEYDGAGKTVWQWSGADYFKTSDLGARMLASGIFDVNDTHANAFYFDEKAGAIYISFRDINRIIEITYPEKKVVHTFGKLYVPGNERDRHLANGMFCGQHSCRAAADGSVYLFNNNICHHAALPTIIKLKQPPPGTDTLEKIWSFDCPIDTPGQRSKMGSFNFGGNLLELADGNLFVCMGGTCGKLFIVDKDKNIVWSSQPEKWDASVYQWTRDGVTLDNNMKEGSYRASIISRAELEGLIWGEGTGK